ncbi:MULTISPECIES: tetratricopeptide repeat protein [unclassified Sinorhizobium]|uniref:TPR end-of-group domain-containing protein n=1 Tax=unclassified Sinorhizobium TaxID=2613772 RepID=UPI0024C3EE33|nr:MULTISPECIES: tetratricopeptide repeat protein [unclassified Sinorhizobium]MDK1375248.1 tetratricopeptide repeat protein [Sinorhizobium sp. 6-70]MDK1478054.1 tetratricopeptide repeat protein [Sinorhizobium sp. 6-117]
MKIEGLLERRLTAILAADVVGYNRLMGTDEAGTLAAMKRHRREFLEPKIANHKGRVVKLAGDSMLVEFSSVVNAVACAAEIQRGMLARNESLPRSRRIELRIGIHLGDVIVEDGDIFGDGVNVAARLEGLAEPSGIAVSASVRDHVGSRLDLGFVDKGEHALKNIAPSVRVYTISFGDVAVQKPAEPATVTVEPGYELSVAVLPFTNMSHDPEQEYFSDGITEDIITDLSKISRLHVVARNTVFTYKGKPVKVKQIAQELGVRFILEGSVRKVGERVRITGQLIDAQTGGHLWADRYDRELTDIFMIQDEITHAIVDQLRIKLLPEEKKAIESDPTTSVEAYTYYLRGRQFSRTWTRPYLLLARRMFLKAVELDPNYARAYAGIAECECAIRDWHEKEFPLESIFDTSAKALALDPNLAEAHASRGLALTHDGQTEEAGREFRQALALEPSLYEANLYYGRFLFAQGRFQEAIGFFERAAGIRPDDYFSPIHLMGCYFSLGMEPERQRWARIGIERAKSALERYPENASPAHRGALALAHMGEAERAKEWVARALAIDPDDVVAQYNAACVYSLLGEGERALDLLETVVPQSSSYHLHWFKQDSDLDPIRDHPRFQALLDAIEDCEDAPR